MAWAGDNHSGRDASSRRQVKRCFGDNLTVTFTEWAHLMPWLVFFVFRAGAGKVYL